MFTVCVLLMMSSGRSTAVCKDGNMEFVQHHRAECLARQKDPMGTCETIVSSDGKRWFFVHTSL